MKLNKGTPGYIQARKNRYLLLAILEFTAVLILVIIGLMRSGSRLNMFTIIAILGCLPGSMMLVEFIILVPVKCESTAFSAEVDQKTDQLVTAYDLILTVEEKIMPVDVLIFSGHVIIGYDQQKRTDEAKVAAYLKEFLSQNHYDKMTVKIFNEYKSFLSRAEELNRKAKENEEEKTDREESIKELLLSVSM